VEQSQRGQHTLMALVAASVLTCVLATGIVAALRLRNFATYQDAIGYVLDQRSVAYQRVLVERAWPDTVNTLYYGANVFVILNDTRRIGGRLECATPDGHRCKVVLRDLNIAGEALPELSEQRRWRLPAWVQKLLPK
jgi:hypothetical protein